MPIATLLLREASSTSLVNSVEKSQQRKPPLPEYELQVTSNQLIFVQLTNFNNTKNLNDEGFESDIDSLSIVSSDDSFSNLQETKTVETDSANGSASSDSDNESPIPPPSPPTTSSTRPTIAPAKATTLSRIKTGSATNESPKKSTNPSPTTTNEFPKECFNLVDCVCYTDIKFPDVLVFVIKNETFVFRFDQLNSLKNFYLNFTALKAVTNQKTYNNQNLSAKFNLLQRTDNNGVTHIEITREPQTTLFLNDNQGPTSIISLNTPECDGKSNSSNGRFSTLNNYKTPNNNRRIVTTNKFPSTENLLNELVRTGNNHAGGANLLLQRKIWNSAEDLLSIPKRPERRKKGKAPQPPLVLSPPQSTLPLQLSPSLIKIDKEDILRGQFVRVNVDNIDKSSKFIIKSQMLETHPKKNFATKFTKLPTTKPLKLLEPALIPATNKRFYQTESSWTNSVPRLLTKKQRSKSETRVFTPMAYRYIDTTTNNLHYPSGTYNASFGATSNQTISNRLFGLSSKLKDFNQAGNDNNNNGRWSSSSEGNLKSVIKKDENRKKNEKKVTFSAYTTVQVV